MFVRMIFAVMAMVLLGGAQAQDERPELWGGLRLGMTPEEVTTVLMTREGVQRTRMGKAGRDGRTTMNVSTRYGAIRVAGQGGTVEPMFTSDLLSSVEIKLFSPYYRYCEPEAARVMALLDELLNIKYSAVIGARTQGYTNGDIRVTPELSVRPPDTSVESRTCALKGQDGTTVRMTLVYEAEEAARARDASEDQADQNRLRETLEGI